MNSGNSKKTPNLSPTIDRTTLYCAALTNSLLNTLIPTSSPQKETHPSPSPSVRPSSSDPRIALPPYVLSSIHSRWENSLIIKLTGKSLDSNHLSTSLRSLWKCKLPIKLVGLGKGFYSCSIGNKEGLQNIKSNGPWFIHGYYLHIQDWKPNFQASSALIKSAPTWIILPELPIEYHRPDIFQAIGNSLGGFIKHDLNGLNRNNARFARISVHLDQSKPQPARVWIGTFCQEIKLVEKTNFFFICQGQCVGSCSTHSPSVNPDNPNHVSDGSKTISPIVDQDKLKNPNPPILTNSPDSSWTLVPFRKSGTDLKEAESSLLLPLSLHLLR
ncbi:uncharacterized protein LOC141633760 [Silene latifolia]|uniref:uncharacterized protein LOC141633760 n=1 Tax=Silene latifolia TaxID=37657 RepID=UPI003D775D8F